jgi:hypothetical protein
MSKNQFLTRINVFLIMVVGSVACIPGNRTATFQSVSPSESALDYAHLQENLQAAGLFLEYPRTEPPDLFVVPANFISVNHAMITTYEFESPAVSATAAAAVSPDGKQVGSQAVDRHGTIHFFQQGRLIVLYAGDFLPVYDALTAMLGPQIAGGSEPLPLPAEYEGILLPLPSGSEMASAPPPAWLVYGNQAVPGTFGGYTTPLIAVEAQLPTSLTAVSLPAATQAVLVVGDITISSFEVAVVPWLTSLDQLSTVTTPLAGNVQQEANVTIFSLLPFKEPGDYLLHANLAYAGGSASYAWHLNLEIDGEG